jgi:hypothetical protein
MASTIDIPPFNKKESSLKNKILSFAQKFPLSRDCRKLMIATSRIFHVSFLFKLLSVMEYAGK